MSGLDKPTLGTIGWIMDQGTSTDGWDIGIMEAIWALIEAQGLTAHCEDCGQDYCIASNDGECPFDFCEPDVDPDDDWDEDEEAEEWPA